MTSNLDPRRALAYLCQEFDPLAFVTPANATDAALAHSVGRILDTQPPEQVTDLLIRYASLCDLPIPEPAPSS